MLPQAKAALLRKFLSIENTLARDFLMLNFHF